MARTAAAGFAFLASLPAFAALALTPRLPLRALLPPIAWVWWATFGLVPVLPHAADWPALGVTLGATQVALAAAVAVGVRRAGWGPGWIDDAQLRGPRFRLSWTAGFLAASLLLLPVLGAGYALLAIGSVFDHYTNGFVQLGGAGIEVAERRYRLGDRVVDLVGMVHVGDAEAYREIFRGFRGEGTVVLEEGVTDESGLLGATLSYQGLSEGLDLALQPRVDAMHAGAEDAPHVLQADVDVAAFSAETLAFLEEIAQLYGSRTRAELLRRLRALTTSPDAARWVAAVERDLIAERNRHLLAVLDDALVEYPRVVVPWGAYHMPGIERALLDRGFHLESERRRLLVPYPALARGAARLLGAGSPTERPLVDVPTAAAYPRANQRQEDGS